jgi:hypothetical protein
MPPEEESVRRHTRAAKEFDRHERRRDGAQVAGSLAGGLDILRDSLHFRVHLDVQQVVGVDSMWLPVSEVDAQRQARTEIDLYSIAESAAAVGESGYVGTADDWYLRWLARLRLGDAHEEAEHVVRLEGYLSRTSDDRRLAFTDVLADVLPDSRRAPLVLFRLLPLAVRIVTALAFGDHVRAREARNSQAAHLPAIRYCRRCRGEVLENGEQCEQCGNPLWEFKWLTATD